MEMKLLEQMQISVFCSSVSMMLHSGASAAEACRLFAEDNDTQGAKAAQLMSGLMDEGCSFAEAAEQIGAFPEYAVGVFKTAEYSGRMEEALGRLAEFYERQDRLMQRLRTTLSYPVVLLLLMCGVLSVLVFSVLPMFEKVYGSLTGGLAASSYAYVSAAAVIGKVSLVVAVAAAVLLLALAFVMRNADGREKLFRRLETVGFTKNAMWLMAVSKLADTLSVMLASGADTDSAMERATELTEHAALKAALEECVERMHEGEGLADSLFRKKIFPVLYGRMLVTGNESGSLGDALERLSFTLGKDAEAKLAGIIDTIEPVLVAFLTVSVGLTLLSVMLPLLGILGAV